MTTIWIQVDCPPTAVTGKRKCIINSTTTTNPRGQIGSAWIKWARPGLSIDFFFSYLFTNQTRSWRALRWLIISEIETGIYTPSSILFVGPQSLSVKSMYTILLLKFILTWCIKFGVEKLGKSEKIFPILHGINSINNWSHGDWISVAVGFGILGAYVTWNLLWDSWKPTKWWQHAARWPSQSLSMTYLEE